MGLSIKDGITPALAKVAAGIADRRPILEAMGTQLLSITSRSFNDASQRVAPWAPLKPATIAAKIKAGKSTAILKRDVLLARSFRVAALTNSSVTVATDRIQAAVHQFGAKKGSFGTSAKGRPLPWGDIPARPMLPFIGGPDSAQLAPWAREKLEKIGRAKIQSLLSQSSG